jgi:hypothetical protein
MPLWASILLPLLVGLVAVAGGILGTYVTGRLERERERRKLLVETARPFAEKLSGAWDSVVYARELAEDELDHREEMKQGLGTAKHLAGEASVPLAPVRLLFGSEIGKAAERALAEVKSTTTYLERLCEAPDPGEAQEHKARAREAYERADEMQRIFFSRAGDAIWQAEIGPVRRSLPGRPGLRRARR